MEIVLCICHVILRYPEARAIQRKIIYHSGPTNSGKTYHALERFLKAKSGVYCGPLRLLANEVHVKTNEQVGNTSKSEKLINSLWPGDESAYCF